MMFMPIRNNHDALSQEIVRLQWVVDNNVSEFGVTLQNALDRLDEAEWNAQNLNTENIPEILRIAAIRQRMEEMIEETITLIQDLEAQTSRIEARHG